MTEMEKVRKAWVESWVGSNNNMQDPEMRRITEQVSKKAARQLVTIRLDGSCLWEDCELYPTRPEKIRAMYQRLEAIAIAYATKESCYYKDETVRDTLKKALDWLDKNAYPKQQQYGNWWQWEIGIPKSLTNICLLMYDDLTKEDRMRLTDTIYYYQPDPFWSGLSGMSTHHVGKRSSLAANRVDLAIVALTMGLLREDEQQLQLASDAITSQLVYQQRTEDGKLIDGFYTDGSFIQHGCVPYTGTYGHVFLLGVGKIAGLLKGSPWQLPQERIEILAKFAKDSYMPLIYNGLSMDMVRGRGVSRSTETDKQGGDLLLNDLLLVSRALDPENAAEIKAFVKYCILADPDRSYIKGLDNAEALNLAEAVLADESIPAQAPEALHKNFPLMDRAIHRGKDYLLGLSMFSSRISNYEYMNGENIRGWHTADGMTYLYNADLTQFSDCFKCTVNPYRMPGTTVSTAILDRENLEENGDNGQELFEKEDWVGGTSMGANGVDGMALTGDLTLRSGEDYPNCHYKSLRAKKSWFMFEDEIVCLGSGIHSEEADNIETIVENRKLNGDASNVLTVNGGKAVEKLGDEAVVDAKWAHLQGNTETGSDIGYYFPEETQLYLHRVANTNAWASVRQADLGAEPVTRNYLEMWIDHGAKPQDAHYAYVLLPGRTAEQVKAYAEQNPVEILANTETVQAIRHAELGLLGINNWTDAAAEAADVIVEGKASVMVQEKDGVLEIAAADPTVKNEGTIRLTVAKPVGRVLSADPEVSVEDLGGKVRFTVQVKGSLGRTYRAKMQLK